MLLEDKIQPLYTHGFRFIDRQILIGLYPIQFILFRLHSGGEWKCSKTEGARLFNNKGGWGGGIEAFLVGHNYF